MLTKTPRHVFAACVLILPAMLSAQTVTDSDIEAVRLANDRTYAPAYVAAGRNDAAITDLVTWQKLRFGDAEFSEYVAFAAKRPDWPGDDVLRAAGEQNIPQGADPAQVIDWFGDRAPRTGKGAVRLAQALIATGEAARARDIVRTGWTELSLSEQDQSLMLATFGEDIADLHRTRVDNLLWAWRTSEAERMRPLLDESQQLLLTARVRLITDAGGVDAALDAVPEPLCDTPGLMYDRYNWAADKGRRDQAVELLLAQSTSAEALGNPFRWSGWRRTLARSEMRTGDAERAYRIASRHFMTADDGYNYSDLEWLSGYLALTYLDDAELALQHFNTFADAVSSPISDGRAGYWQGRALESLGRTEEANAAFTRAGVNQTSFYGLLAADRMDMQLDPALIGADEGLDWQTSDIIEEDRVRVAIALLEARQRSKAIAFVNDLGETLAADDIARLGRAFAARDETYLTVLLGKAAAARGVVVPSAYFPLHPVADMDLPVPADLTLAIARRESEFYIRAGSPVGAQGLMQLMPATAQEVSGQLGLTYAKSKLTADWRYNAELGAAYLAGLRERFGDSPIQVAAGYNAGPSRPANWMNERGDPRTGEVDIVDWIEHIPFRETRNYVQRVSESLPVYRARLTGVTAEIDFLAMITGSTAAVRPTLRPDGSLEQPVPQMVVAAPRPEVRPNAELVQARVATSTAPEDVANRIIIPEGSAPETTLRPIPRP
ncbi:lytic transglycosylase domain-containing protein [Loktanella sp. SALINAS62]|uniref:lytic transglycosylase domain-containing protein n=1 Tax=Loktanella sp. SALINAS62 TaxID=2706124 RepID=UPI001B8C63BD|nr:lytic transglycosylase domain-containing protein [Loktanella sp. SALINAS62]MBS1300986.1 lytic transglycosylase domain-containing protein [Loktanella sp. SALINAS62]